MSTVGIIAEYDPFHYGHLYQLQKARELTGADQVVVVLGGDFLQRGMPALADRGARARMAVDAGADLVLSMPCIYSVNSAREYACGAVGILAGAGCADFLSFGSETADPLLLRKVASIMSREEELSPLIKEYLSAGLSHAESFTRAVERIGGEKAASLLRQPNDLLACEYIRSLEESGFSAEIVPVKRQEGTVSASQIRSLAVEGNLEAVESFVPASTYRVLKDCFRDKDPHSVREYMDRRMMSFLRYRILTSDREELSAILSAGEGIEKRLIKAAADQRIDTVSKLADAVRTKRYPRARIMRLLTHVLLGLKAEDFYQLKGTYYARVLAFNQNGRKLLAGMRKTSAIPVLSNLSRTDRYDFPVKRSLELDLRAAGIYAMLRGSGNPFKREIQYVPYMPADC